MPFGLPKPFSVPDDLADPWNDMVRLNRLLQASNDPLSFDGTQGVAIPAGQVSNDDDLPVNDWMTARNEDVAGLASGSGASGDVAGGDGLDQQDPTGANSTGIARGVGDGQLLGAQGGSPGIGGLVSGRIGDFMAKDAQGRPLHPIGHPGLAESFVPVLGSGHEALADLQEGHPLLAVANGTLAVAEMTGVGEVGSDIAKLGLRLGRSQTWNAVRKAALKDGLVQPFQPGHHIVPRHVIPGWVPDAVTNNWLNILPMKDQVIDGVAHTGAQVHSRIHGRALVNGELLPRFNPLQQFQYGTKNSTRALLGGIPETLGRVGGDWIFDQSGNPNSGDPAQTPPQFYRP